MKYLDYRKKLGIGFNDNQLEKFFLQRMKNYLEVIRSDETYVYLANPRMMFDYCNITGADFENMDTSDCLDSIVEDITYVDDIREFLAKYSVLLHLIKENQQEYRNLGDMLRHNLTEARIPYELLEDDDGLFVFPKGAQEMDNALVSEPLSWLQTYPKSHTAFTKALKEYSEATASNASDVADKFRKTLETFLREFFNNSAPLEKNKVEYGRYLKSRGVPAELTGNMETLLQAYANFMNGYAKHQDATSVNVLEYIMYQTGNIIRFLITLKQEETSNID